MAITYSGLYLKTRKELKDAGSVSPDLAARELVCCASGKSREKLIRDGGLYVPPEIERKVGELTKRHLDGEPVAYIIGEWEFYGLTLSVSPSVLIPRPDTEVLVEKAVEYLKKQGPCRVLDLCAGSGCVGIAIASQIPETKIVLADCSDPALKICNRNIWSNSFSGRVVPVRADALEEPDHIPSDEIEKLDRSVKDYEPRIALDGGADGLNFYRAIAEKWRAAIRPGGRIFFEIGINQVHDVSLILRVNGYGEIQHYDDKNGIPRVITGMRYPDI